MGSNNSILAACRNSTIGQLIVQTMTKFSPSNQRADDPSNESNITNSSNMLSTSILNHKKEKNVSVHRLVAINPSHKACINILFCNARSVVNKISDLHFLLAQSNNVNDNTVSIIAVCETWLNESFPDDLLLNGSNFIVFRKDRLGSKSGGGVCIFVSNIINVCKCTPKDEFKDFEIISIDVGSLNCKRRLICAYRPPAVSSEYSKMFFKCLEELCNVNFPCIVMGDFNMPHVLWKDGVPQNIRNKTPLSKFVSNGMRQLVNFETRGANALDLVFCNYKNVLSNITLGPPFSSSDHNSIEMKCYFPEYKHSEIDYREGKWDFWKKSSTYFNNYLFNQNFNLIPYKENNNIYALVMSLIKQVAVYLFISNRKNKQVYNPSKNAYNHPYIKRLQHKKLFGWRYKTSTKSVKFYRKLNERYCQKLCTGKKTKITSRKDPKTNKKLTKKANLPYIKNSNGELINDAMVLLTSAILYWNKSFFD